MSFHLLHPFSTTYFGRRDGDRAQRSRPRGRGEPVPQAEATPERPSSPLRPHLMSSTSLIYPQGSMAIGATIVSGTEDDRFESMLSST